MKKQWFKDGNFWRHPGGGNYGDLIFNTMSRIIDMGDESEWAYSSLHECADLLIAHKRWPDRFNDPNDAKNLIVYKWNKFLKWLGVEKDYPGRFQSGMTRDPYVAFYCCAMFLGEEHYIGEVKNVWYSANLNYLLWRKRLMGNRKLPWVNRLEYYRSLAKVILYSTNPNIVANKEDART